MPTRADPTHHNPPLAEFRCQACAGKLFASKKALDQHMRIKHKVLNPIASRLPDTMRCPVCQSDFHSRMQLVAHLSDTRVRSRVRGKSYHSVFMASHDALPISFLDSGWNAALGGSRRRAQAAGSTHENATLRCASGRPSVLKGLTPTLQQRGLPNRRICIYLYISGNVGGQGIRAPTGAVSQDREDLF